MACLVECDTLQGVATGVWVELKLLLATPPATRFIVLSEGVDGGFSEGDPVQWL